MIAHVAEAGEQRGRVVLQHSSSGIVSDIALEAAVRVAQAFGSEIESLFVEDEGLVSVAGYTFARELSLSGRSMRNMVLENIERDMRHAGAMLQRRVSEHARRAEVPIQCRTIRDDPLRALAIACSENGPWNVVAISETWTFGRSVTPNRLLAAVDGTTGVILAGPKARRVTGPVVVLIEDYDRLHTMLRTSRRIAAVAGSDVRIFVVGSECEAMDWVEGQVRLALGGHDQTHITVGELERQQPAAIAETLRRLGAGFVIAQAGGIIDAGTNGHRPLATELEGPVFLVR